MSGNNGWVQFEHACGQHGDEKDRCEKSVVEYPDGRRVRVLTRPGGPGKDMIYLQVMLADRSYVAVLLSPDGELVAHERARTAEDAVSAATAVVNGLSHENAESR